MDLGKEGDAGGTSQRATVAAFQHALSLHRQGKLSDAERQYRAVLTLDDAHGAARHGLGVLRLQQRDFEGAALLFRQVLESDASFADAHNNLGVALHELKRDAEAATHFVRALSIAPDHADAHNNLGNLLHSQGRHSEAAEHFGRALSVSPNHAAARKGAGRALHALGRNREAIANFERVLAARADDAEACNGLGYSLEALCRYDEAIAAYERALAIAPDYVDVYSNLAHVLLTVNRHEDAVAACDKALAIQPDHAEAQFNQASTRLAMGDFAAGLRQYEWRWHSLRLPRRKFPRPLWLGTWDVAGKTVLLHAEQGVGDTLQFVRYIPLVAQLGARVALVVQRPLLNLLAGLEGVATLCAQGDTLPQFDCHCPLMSLPLAFGTTAETIPASVPYLAPPPGKVLQWRSQIDRHPRPLIGLVWSGSREHKNDHNRSIPVQYLLPLLKIPGFTFFALQKELRDGDAAQFEHAPHVISLGAQLNDFTDTAAIISLLDLVITVDTAVAHLAGAMGKPVWMLLPFSADWRWMRERSDSPWYPTARLFRQLAIGDWASVVSEVQRALALGLRS